MEECPQQDNGKDCGVFPCGALACAAYAIRMRHNPVRAGRTSDEYRMRIGHGLEKKEIRFTLTANENDGARVVQPEGREGHRRDSSGEDQRRKRSKDA